MHQPELARQYILLAFDHHCVSFRWTPRSSLSSVSTLLFEAALHAHFYPLSRRRINAARVAPLIHHNFVSPHSLSIIPYLLTFFTKTYRTPQRSQAFLALLRELAQFVLFSAAAPYHLSQSFSSGKRHTPAIRAAHLEQLVFSYGGDLKDTVSNDLAAIDDSTAWAKPPASFRHPPTKNSSSP